MYNIGSAFRTRALIVIHQGSILSSRFRNRCQCESIVPDISNLYQHELLVLCGRWMDYVIPDIRTCIAHDNTWFTDTATTPISISEFYQLFYSWIIATACLFNWSYLIMSNPQLLDIEPGGENTQYAHLPTTWLKGFSNKITKIWIHTCFHGTSGKADRLVGW